MKIHNGKVCSFRERGDHGGRHHQFQLLCKEWRGGLALLCSFSIKTATDAFWICCGPWTVLTSSLVLSPLLGQTWENRNYWPICVRREERTRLIRYNFFFCLLMPESAVRYYLIRYEDKVYPKESKSTQWKIIYSEW